MRPWSFRHRPAPLVAAAVIAVALVSAGCTPVSGQRAATTTAPAATPTATRAPAPACAQGGLPTTVRYRTIAGVPANLTSLDVHAPAKACDAPVVIWVHGGGYRIGDKRNQMADKVRLFNQKGWILVSVNYRLTTPGTPGSAFFPDHYEDVAAALGWVHAQIARYGGDPERTALLGHSAGADIVSNITAQPSYLAKHRLAPSDLACTAPLDTAGFDKLAVPAGASERQQWYLALGRDAKRLAATSATRLVKAAGSKADVPSTFTVFRGNGYRPRIQKAYAAALRAAGTDVALVDASKLSHNEVNTRIGARGDTIMTPPLVRFLTSCFAP
jgi:carboxylesterase type B